MLFATVSEFVKVEPVKKRFPRPDDYRGYCDMHFVDQAFLEKLSDGMGTSADADIFPARSVASQRQRFPNASRHEIEGRAAFHLDRIARVVAEHKDRHVVRRVVAPPAFPFVIRPRAANGPEHVPAKNPCSHVGKPACRDLVINPRGTTVC